MTLRERTLASVALAALLFSSSALADGTFFRPAAPSVIPAAEARAGSNETADSAPEVLQGAPQVVDTATLVVDGHRVSLSGLTGLGGNYVTDLQQFLTDAGGNFVTCTLVQGSLAYKCVSGGQHVNVADAALLNGAAQASADATPAQRVEEDKARTAQRGIWKSTGEQEHP